MVGEICLIEEDKPIEIHRRKQLILTRKIDIGCLIKQQEFGWFPSEALKKRNLEGTWNSGKKRNRSDTERKMTPSNMAACGAPRKKAGFFWACRLSCTPLLLFLSPQWKSITHNNPLQSVWGQKKKGRGQCVGSARQTEPFLLQDM